MKKLLTIVVLGLLWSGNSYAEEFYINCKSDNKTTFLFKINESKKKMTIINGPAGKILTTNFNDEIIEIEIKDVEAYIFDPQDNTLNLNFKGDYKFRLNRISGEMDYLHENPKKENGVQSYTKAMCSKTKKKI